MAVVEKGEMGRRILFAEEAQSWVLGFGGLWSDI